MKSFIIKTVQLLSVIIIIGIIVIAVGAWITPQRAKLTVKVCYDIADIEISKCQNYENGCINPKVLVNVVSDSPNATASVINHEGFYVIKNNGHEPRVIHIDKGEHRYETFGCSEEKK